jgi:hypothetical protein
LNNGQKLKLGDAHASPQEISKKYFGCVVCRFHVTVGAKLHPREGAIYKLYGAVAKPASINLRKLVLSPTGSINLGFILREDLMF